MFASLVLGGGVITDATATPEKVDPGYIFYNNNGKQVGAKTDFAHITTIFTFEIGDVVEVLTDRDKYASWSAVYRDALASNSTMYDDTQYFYTYDAYYGQSSYDFNGTIIKSMSTHLELQKTVMITITYTDDKFHSYSSYWPISFTILLPCNLADGYHRFICKSKVSQYAKEEYCDNLFIHITSNIIDNIYIFSKRESAYYSGIVTLRQLL